MYTLHSRVQAVITALYGPCTRPLHRRVYTGRVHGQVRGPVHGHAHDPVHVYTARTRLLRGGVRAVNTAEYTCTDRIHESVQAVCTAVTRSCTGREHSRVHGPYTAVYMPSTRARTRPCTRSCTRPVRGCYTAVYVP